MLTFNRSLWQEYSNHVYLRGLPIPGWATLNRIRLTRTIKFLWLWTIFIPVIAKLISGVPESVGIPFTDTLVDIHLRLPFSWSALYFSGVAFAIGGSIFAMRCPRLIQEFPDVRALADAEAISPVEAAAYCAELFAADKFAISNTQFIAVTDAAESMWKHYGGPSGVYSLEEVYLRHPTSGIERIRVLVDAIDARLDLLTRMYVFASMARFWARALCAVTYLIGGGFMLIVLTQNFIFVVSAVCK